MSDPPRVDFSKLTHGVMQFVPKGVMDASLEPLLAVGL